MKKKNLLTLCGGEATTNEITNYKITMDDISDISNLYVEVMLLENEYKNFPERDYIKDKIASKLEILKVGMNLINDDIGLKYKTYKKDNESVLTVKPKKKIIISNKDKNKVKIINKTDLGK